MCAGNQELDLQLVGGDLSCHLLQKSSHRRTGVLYAECVLTLHEALMIWATSGDSPAVGRCPTKLLLPGWADPGLDKLRAR